MNIIHDQDNQLSKNLSILIGICLRTAILTIVGGYISAFRISIVFEDFHDEMTGGIIPIVLSGVGYFYQFILGIFMTVIPITEVVISIILLNISRLFQSGDLKSWKLKVSNLLVVLMNILKVLFSIYLLFLILATYKYSLLLSVVFALQIIASVKLIVFSVKLIYRPSYKKIKELQF